MINRATKAFTLSLILPLLSMGQGQRVSWTLVAPGVWKGITGKPESYDLIKAAGSIPDKTALGRMKAVGFPVKQNEIASTITDGKTYLRFPLDKEEQLY